MVTQSSNQSQNQITQKVRELRNYNVIWKIMRTPVLEFL